MQKCIQAIWKQDRFSTPGDTGQPISQSGLPEDLARDASKRLGIACLVYAFAYTMAFYGSAVPDLLQTGSLPAYVLSWRSIVALISIAVALWVFAITLKERYRPERLLGIGLAFEVVGAAGISIATFWGIFPPEVFPTPEAVQAFIGDVGLNRSSIIGIPWTCMWIIMFPFLAPSKPSKALSAALAAASTDLGTVLLSQHYGATSPHFPFSFFFTYFLFSTYLCACIACISGHGLLKIGRHLRQARDFGSYRLTTLLGRGGMGEVWLARHNMLARPAAIKLIRPEVLGIDEPTRRSVLQRFKREAQATAALRSCHTIDIYDFGTSNDGSFYYVMELLDGLDLGTLVKRFGPLPASRAVHILRQACHSLMDAHENGMIHRDVKPANIYLCRLGPDHDFVKVLDFGLVKTNRSVPTGASQVTLFGTAIGSPGYMAPELALGKTDIDARADIYALGCVGYWLLCGQLVFEGDTAMATLVQQVNEIPLPPSQRTELPIPPSLEKIILACLAKDPGERPQTIRDLDALLTACDLPDRWTETMAREWWELHGPVRLPPGAGEGEETVSLRRAMDDSGPTSNS